MTRFVFRGMPVAIAVLAFSLTPASHAQRLLTCQPQLSKTLASNVYAQVYGKSGRAFVCLRGTRSSTRLRGALPAQDQFALGGKYVAWSSGPQHTVVNVMYIPTGAMSNEFPFDTNDHVDKIVVKSNGASAWAVTPSEDNTYVQGMERKNHAPNLFSDDSKDVLGSSLRSLAGRAISWRYTDGSSGTANLF